ncbi:MAG: LamG domain-containing protein [Bacteroidia bacterium]
MDGLDFDGDGDYISIPALSGIKTGAYMLEVLLRTDRHDDAPARGVIGSSSNLELATDLPSSNFGVAVGIKPGKFVSLIQAVNVQGKGLYYVDGRYVSDWDNKGSSTASTIRVDIGKSGRVGLPTFKGRIYEVRIHNVKWGETSVLQNFNKYRAVDDSTIIAHFKLGKARNGILYSERGDVAAQVYIKPRLEQLQFDGIRFTDANQFGQLPMSDKYCGTGTYTVEAWIKPDVVDANSRFLVRGIQFAPRVAIQNGGLSARWYTASNGFKQVDSPKNLIKAGVWQHIAVSWDGQQIGLYVNGVLVKGGSHEGGLQKGATEIAVGRRELNKTTENYLGSIEEVRIWNTARTQAEIGRYMKYRLIGNEPGLVAYYPISLVDTNPLKDYGPNGLHGKLNGIVSAIVPVGANSPTTSTTNSPVQRKQVQAVGHSHLKIGGREVMVADMRLSDDEFWFKGNINLFPADSKLKVSGLAEALIKKDSLYLYSDTEVALFGMTLSKSKMLITHQQMRIEGQFLGINTLLDVVWSGNDPRFTGRVWADYSRTFDIGAIYINGVRMCDNYRISLDVGFDIGLDITKSAFKANVAAKFKVADVGFDYSFTLDSAFPDLDALGDYLRDELAANASKYLSHIFSSALNYITEAVDGALEFLGNNLVQLGNILGGAFQTAWTEVADFWIQAGGEFVDLYQVLRGPLAVGLNDLASKFKQLGAGFGEIAEVFQGWGNTLSDTAGALINGAGATIDQAVSVMEDLGKNVTEAGVAIKNAVGEQWNAITQALNKYYDPNLVARVLKEDLGRTVNQVASIYKAISLDLDKAYDAVAFAFGGGNLASKAFRSAGYICDDVGKMLRRYFDVSQVSSILKGSGYSTKEVTSMLKSVYNYSKSQAESILKGIESDVNVIGDALKQVFG